VRQILVYDEWRHCWNTCDEDVADEAGDYETGHSHDLSIIEVAVWMPS